MINVPFKEELVLLFRICFFNWDLFPMLKEIIKLQSLLNGTFKRNNKMNICGIELKANQTILAVQIDGEYKDLKTKKITLEDDELQESIRSYCNDLLVFLTENDIEQVYIKKRAKKGNFAGGAITFKMESLIQLNPKCLVDLVSAQAMGSFERKNSVEYPEALNKYQEQAYLAILASI